MIYFPFLFFSGLLIWHIRKQGFDVYAYVLLIYVISSLLSIFLDLFNLYNVFDIFKHPLGFIAPIVYCLLLTISCEPFKYFHSNNIKHITRINEKHYNYVVYMFFILFVINFVISISKIQDIILNNALGSVRDNFYHGDAEFMWSAYSGWFRYFIAICSLLSPCSVLMILFFFINISFLKKSFLFNLITLFGSFSRLIQSLFIADRSGFIHYIIIAILCFILVKSHFSKEMLRRTYFSGILILSLLLFYIISVTISRFGGADGSNLESIYDSLVYYGGQSYIHFCNFFNVLDLNAPISLVSILPLTYYFLGLPSYFEQAEIVESYYHHGVSNFSTFLGMILSISGKFVMFLFVFIYYVISSKIIHRRHKSRISIKKIIYFFIVVLVVSNGLFGYYYMAYVSIVHILIWIIIARWITVRNNNIKSLNLKHSE